MLARAAHAIIELHLQMSVIYYLFISIVHTANCLIKGFGFVASAAVGVSTCRERFKYMSNLSKSRNKKEKKEKKPVLLYLKRPKRCVKCSGAFILPKISVSIALFYSKKTNETLLSCY